MEAENLWIMFAIESSAKAIFQIQWDFVSFSSCDIKSDR